MQPNPDCPDCRGTGRIVLFTSSGPCGCTERPEPDGPSEAWLESLRGIMDWGSTLFAREKTPPADGADGASR